jgi:hypothetical protein
MYETRIAGTEAGLMIGLSSSSSIAKNFVLSDIAPERQVGTEIKDQLYLIKTQRGRGVHSIAGHHEGGVIQALFPKPVSYATAKTTAERLFSSFQQEINNLDRPLIAIRPLLASVVGEDQGVEKYNRASIDLIDPVTFKSEISIKNRSAIKLVAPSIAGPTETVQVEAEIAYEDIQRFTWTVRNTKTEETVHRETYNRSFDIDRFETFNPEAEGVHRVNFTLKRENKSTQYSRVESINVDREMETGGLR